MRVFEIAADKCRGCLSCFDSCPTDAICVGAYSVTIDYDRCVACGKCISRCIHGAIIKTSQLSRVKDFVAKKRKVILAIDPACAAFLPQGITMEHIAAAAQKVGVWDVADASEASAAVAAEYAKIITLRQVDNLVFSDCPVIVNMIEQYFPKVLKYLAPVASPMVVQGRMLKRDFTSAAVVYVTPCIARLQEADDVRHSTEVNAVLSMDELFQWFREEQVFPEQCEEEPLLSEGGGIGGLFAVVGGTTECTEYYSQEHGLHKMCVDGIDDCWELLEALSQGTISGCMIEMKACPGGCIGSAGCTRTKAQNRFLSTVRLRNYVKSGPMEPYFDVHGIALSNPGIDYSVPKKEFTQEQIQQMMYLIGVGNPKQQLNCGECGFASCRDRAVAVLQKKEMVSLCRRVVHENKQDVHGVLYEALPMAVLLIDDTQRIVGFNEEAASLMALKEGQEKYVFELMDPEDVQYAINTGLAIRNRRVDIPELFLRARMDLVPLKKLNMVAMLLEDVTEEEEEESRRLQSRLQSVEMAQKVIEKQMTVAQQIAFLLGETTAETKVTLNQLKHRILEETEA